MTVDIAHVGASTAAAFLASLVEFVEALTVILAVGSVRGWRSAIGGALAALLVLLLLGIGALAALLVVVALGAALHRPLAAIPENTLKFAVGILLAAFGTFWTGEGIGLQWPGGDWSLLGLIFGFLAIGLATVPLARGRAAEASWTAIR